MYFHDYEIDDCSGAFDRNLYIRFLFDGPGLNGSIDYSKLPTIRSDTKKFKLDTSNILSIHDSPVPPSSSTTDSPSHSLFSRHLTPRLSRFRDSGASTSSSVSLHGSKSKKKSKEKKHVYSDLELFERAKIECEMTEEERKERESLFSSLTPEDREKMEQYRKMCEEANDIFKSIHKSGGNSSKKPMNTSASTELDFSLIPNNLTLPTLNSEGEEEEVILGDSAFVPIEIEEDGEEVAIGDENEEELLTHKGETIDGKRKKN